MHRYMKACLMPSDFLILDPMNFTSKCTTLCKKIVEFSPNYCEIMMKNRFRPTSQSSSCHNVLSDTGALASEVYLFEEALSSVCAGNDE